MRRLPGRDGQEVGPEAPVRDRLTPADPDRAQTLEIRGSADPVTTIAPAPREVSPIYEFNLLVSCAPRGHAAARGEILKLLRFLGDEQPLVARTAARGIVGVKTTLDPRLVVQELRALLARHPRLLQHTCKWVPIDLWTFSDIDSMQKAVGQLKDRIADGETWRMSVERRRYGVHTRELIERLAPLVTAKADLSHPQRILRVDIIGPFAALAVLGPAEILSAAKAGR